MVKNAHFTMGVEQGGTSARTLTTSARTLNYVSSYTFSKSVRTDVVVKYGREIWGNFKCFYSLHLCLHERFLLRNLIYLRLELFQLFLNFYNIYKHLFWF